MKKQNQLRDIKRFSVIIPAYNSEKTLSACLESLEDQSLSKEDYEVIVVDDGSTDSTATIAKKFNNKYIYQTNQGPASARNKGVKSAVGDIVLFTDSDCVPEPNWIEEMAKPFDNPGVVAVKGAYITAQKSLTARFAQIEFEERYRLLLGSKYIDMIDTYSAAYRKLIFLSLGGFDPSFPVANNEDTELSYKMSGAGYKMLFNPKAVVCHLNHPDSIRKYARLKFWRGYWRMVVYKRYPDKMIKDTYTPQTLKLQILFILTFLASLFFMSLWPSLMYYPLWVSGASFVLAALPLTVSALKKDLFVGVFSLLFISLRAMSLGLGALWGVITWRERASEHV